LLTTSTSRPPGGRTERARRPEQSRPVDELSMRVLELTVASAALVTAVLIALAR
jgi:hypothetical protein